MAEPINLNAQRSSEDILALFNSNNKSANCIHAVSSLSRPNGSYAMLNADDSYYNNENEFSSKASDSTKQSSAIINTCSYGMESDLSQVIESTIKKSHDVDKKLTNYMHNHLKSKVPQNSHPPGLQSSDEQVDPDSANFRYELKINILL